MGFVDLVPYRNKKGEDFMYSLLVLNFIVPIVMILVGYILKKHPASDMNSQNGYNTPASRKSQEHWDYAQSIAPDMFLGLGKIAGIGEIILNIFLFLLKVPINISITAGTVVGFIFLVFGFYKTETNIKNKFAPNKQNL